jgi:hypothetical protein
VSVTIKGYTYRSSVAVMGGEFMVGVSAQVREAAGGPGGDVVDVDMELDTAPREVDVAPELAKALKADPKAKQAFDALSYSNQRRHAEPIAAAKTDETRRRRLAKTLTELRGS